MPPVSGHVEHVTRLQLHAVLVDPLQTVQHWLGVPVQVREVDQTVHAGLLVRHSTGPEPGRVCRREESPSLGPGDLTDEVLPVGVPRLRLL